MGLRVTGGRFCGRRLRSSRGAVRPTSDRVRESVFARLGDLEGASVLDLFAGTGALGIEALSRGARSLVSVERAHNAVEVLRSNIEALGLGAQARVVAGDAARAVHRLGRAGERFDLVLVDPPYRSDESRRALEALVAGEVLAEGAVVVLERSRRHAMPCVTGLTVLDERCYGDTVITRFAAAPPAVERAEHDDPGGLSGT